MPEQNLSTMSEMVVKITGIFSKTAGIFSKTAGIFSKTLLYVSESHDESIGMLTLK